MIALSFSGRAHVWALFWHAAQLGYRTSDVALHIKIKDEESYVDQKLPKNSHLADP